MTAEPRLYATLVDRLSDVPGVVACAAFEPDGQCIACFVGELFEELGAGHVIPILRDLSQPGEDTMPFEEGVTFVERKLVRVLLRRTPMSTFVVLVMPEGDVDVVVAHLGRALDVVARASRMVSTPPAAPSTSIAPPPLTPRSAASGFYPKQSTGASSEATQSAVPPAARIVDEDTVKKLEELVLANLGFAADVVFDRFKASVANHAGQVPRGRWLELVGRLASEIEDDDAREAFVTAALAMPTRSRDEAALDLLSPLARYMVERRKSG